MYTVLYGQFDSTPHNVTKVLRNTKVKKTVLSEREVILYFLKVSSLS